LRTVTYTELKNRFTSAIGVDTLLSVEETAFKNSLNDRVKGAWTRAQWPELMTVVEKSVAAVTSPIVADKAVQIDNDANLMDVFSVFDKNPLSDRTAFKLDYNLINGYLVLPANSSQSSVFVMGNQVTPSSYGDGGGETSTLPRFLERYLLLATIADWYKSDGQLEKAIQQEQMAEETLALEIDRVERLEGMNKISVNTYPSYSFGVNILTTV
tara:strand:- start:726 stop:1364 length:639 start_codon:yes stop_codon:yes gene_type:complete